MSLNPLLQLLVPKERKFFDMFEKASANLVKTGKALYDAVNTPPGDKRLELLKEVARLEHVGDEITHQIFQEVGSTFITPFDREDIQRLASEMDDILDCIHGAAKRIELYKIGNILPSIVKLAELCLEACTELNKAIPQLRDLRNVDQIREACIVINSIENHADDISDMTLARLFEEETNAIEVIKLKEIINMIETATDRCEDVANVLESILIKES
jgi:predicted phosphate transport protein (TIGR00153 family)